MTYSLEELAKKVGECLLKEKASLVTAESCTGGGLSYWITAIPGSSAWFDRGFITYSNAAKSDLLKVKSETLTENGAVSVETAKEMAEGALKNSNATIAIAITGIAGPEGGTQEKPVGSVWIAWAFKNAPTKAQAYLWRENRTEIRQRSIRAALEQLLVFLKAA